jgi:aspartate kinase
MSELVVHKYGGTSVGTPERLAAVADRIQRVHKGGTPIVVVVSAMGDTTDDLLRLAHEVSPSPHSREVDMLLTAGERISMALLTMALRDRGVEAISLTGSQCGIVTDNNHRRARITKILGDRVRKGLTDGKVVIVAGFQGVSPEKEITTLGRGGTDTTAVAIAAALGAGSCDIFTDVAGVYTADPRWVPEARSHTRLPLDLAAELASSGAGVLHPRSVELALKYRMPVRVLSSFSGSAEENGTELFLEGRNLVEKTAYKGSEKGGDVSRAKTEKGGDLSKDKTEKGGDVSENQTSMEAYSVVGVTADTDKLLCEIESVDPASLALAWRKIRESLLEVDRPQVRANRAWFWIHSEAREKWEGVLGGLESDGLISAFAAQAGIQPVTVVGDCFGQENEVLLETSELLGREGIGIHAVSTSHRSITLGVGSEQVEKTVQILHHELIGSSAD